MLFETFESVLNNDSTLNTHCSKYYLTETPHRGKSSHHNDLALTIDGRCNCPEDEHKPLHPWERGLVDHFRRLLNLDPLAISEEE